MCICIHPHSTSCYEQDLETRDLEAITNSDFNYNCVILLKKCYLYLLVDAHWLQCYSVLCYNHQIGMEKGKKPRCWWLLTWQWMNWLQTHRRCLACFIYFFITLTMPKIIFASSSIVHIYSCGWCLCACSDMCLSYCVRCSTKQ